MNPFSLDLNKETLFNIVSGKAASKEATSFLLNVINIGNRAREEFIEQRKSSPRTFEERIKKQKVHSFAKEGVNFKLTNKNKIMELKVEIMIYFEAFYLLLYNGKLMSDMLWLILMDQCKRLLKVHCLKS